MAKKAKKPDFESELTKLEEVSLYNNQLTGCVPKCIDVCASTISGYWSCRITWSSTNPGITGRCPCACGEYHKDGTTCTACEAGGYCPDGSATEMIPCPAGKFGNSGLTGQSTEAAACPNDCSI